MKTLKFAAPAALSVVLVALCSCSITSDSALHKETRTTTVSHVPDSALDVLTDNGGISIQAGVSEEVELVAEIRARTAERLAAVKVAADRNGETGLLRVRVEWPDGRRRNKEGCSFSIRVPDANGVEARTSNGRIRIAGLSGNARLHSSNGAIDVKNQRGDVVCRTSNGAITVDGTEGPIDARTSNGRIEIHEAKQAVKAHSSNGAVQIELAQAGTGPVDAETSNGRMTLTVSRAFEGELELKTSNGSLNVSGLPDARIVTAGKHHMVLRLGESSNRSRLATSNGGIQVATGPRSD